MYDIVSVNLSSGSLSGAFEFMDSGERCRKLCEQIESHYLHRDKFKLSAAIK